MVVAVASPSSAAPPAGRPHPAYKEMVVQALTELRDPGGSSRQAIGKYIADHFSGLHSSHEALLSAHLRRLKSQGQLRLVSGNYFLSTEAPPPQQRRGRGRPPKSAASGQKRGRGRPRKNADLAPSAPIPNSEGPKRGPGRPRKNALVPVASSASPLLGATASPPPSGVKRGRGRPRKNSLVPVASSASPLLGATASPLPSGVKRGRGRPRKNALVPVASSASPLLGAIAAPPSSGVKRGRGRPRKNALVPVASSASQLLGAIALPSPSGVKRGRGRPRKNALVLLASSAPPPSGDKRGRGRPRKNALVLLASSVPPQPGAIALPPSGVKRGRGRLRKNALVPVASSSLQLPRAIAMLPPSGVKRGRGRPRKNPYPVASPLLGVVSVSSNSVVGVKRGRGRPPKAVVAGKRKRGRPPKEKMQPESGQSTDAPLTKRGPGRPRKEKTLEGGQLNAAQTTGDQHEALPAQATGQAGAVQNEVEARSLQSFGTYLTEKRDRGRPRKRPLETETAETGVAASVEKRGRGRPRKKNRSAGTSTESGLTASMGIKRGPGRPRKVRPFETGVAETADEVSRHLIEERPEKDEDLASGKKAETQNVLLVEEIDAKPADAGCVLVSGEEAATAPMDAVGNHFLMGGELYDTTKPDVFLFGDQQDLELLGNKPIKFPYSSKGVTDTVNVINVLVNARRDSIKFTKVGRAGTGYSSGFYRLEFIFDCDVSCYIQIHFCAKEFIDEHQQIHIVGRQSQFHSSERYHFPVGANQQFSHFIFKPHRYDLKQMHWDGGLHFPLIIEIRSVTDRFPEQMQMTMCSIERSTDQSAALILKPLKQKLISNGVVFLLQEIFGIENKENAESVLAEENGAECIICMANPRDTMILPCRHLCICNGCAETLRYKLNNCPICRSPFKALLKIKAIRSSLVGMGSDGTASTMRIRREPLTLFEAINGPFHTGTTPMVMNKTQTLAKCSMGGNVVTTSTIPTSTNVEMKLSNIQRQPTINPEPIKMTTKRWEHQNEKMMELDIEQIELEEMDSKRRKVSNSAGFIQYSPGTNSITRRSSPSPPHSLWRAQSPFSTANSSYQSARSIAQKVQSEEEQEKNNKIGHDLLLASAPNLISNLEEISVENEEEGKVEKIVDEQKNIGEKRKGPIKRMSEPPTASTSSSSTKSSSIPVKQRPHKTMKTTKSLTEQKK